jgi:hypothetical protein
MLRRWRSQAAAATLGGAPLPLLASFWVLGLLNNSAYVICLALATEISSGGVGLVYFAAIAPTIAVKATVSLVRFFQAPVELFRSMRAALLVSDSSLLPTLTRLPQPAVPRPPTRRSGTTRCRPACAWRPSPA